MNAAEYSHIMAAPALPVDFFCAEIVSRLDARGLTVILTLNREISAYCLSLLRESAPMRLINRIVRDDQQWDNLQLTGQRDAAVITQDLTCLGVFIPHFGRLGVTVWIWDDGVRRADVYGSMSEARIALMHIYGEPILIRYGRPALAELLKVAHVPEERLEGILDLYAKTMYRPQV